MMAAVLTIVLFAAPSETVSRAHFVKAQKAFSQHDWRHALDEFTAAGEAAPAELPDLWFDIAQCHRNLGHARQAAAAFTRYLSLAPEAPDRDKVRALVVSLGGKPPDDPAPAVAAPAAPVAAAPAPIALDAPSAAPAPGPPIEPTTVPVAASALPLVPAADTPPPHKPHRRWKLWTGLAIGAAVVAVGVGLGVGLGTASNGASSPTQPLPALGSAATFDTRGH